MNNRAIELGIKAVSIVMAIDALMGIYVTSSSMFSGVIDQPVIYLAFVLAISLNICMLIGGYGLWKAIHWGWWIGAAWCLYTVAEILYSARESYFFPFGAQAFWLVLYVGALAAFFSSHAFNSFGISTDRKLAAIGVMCGGALFFAFPYIVMVMIRAFGT